MQGVAVLIGKDLNLDMAGAANRLLDERGRVAERAFGLAHSRADRFAQSLWIVDPEHAAAAAAGYRLHEDREADVMRIGYQLLQVGRGRGGFEGGQSGSFGGLERPYLVAGQLQHLCRRPDERNPGFETGPGQVGILAQEPVTGIDRVSTGLLRRLNHRLDVEVGPDRMPTLPDLVCPVRLDKKQSVWKLVGGGKGSVRGLTSIGVQYLGEHASGRATDSGRSETGWRSGVESANRTV